MLVKVLDHFLHGAVPQDIGIFVFERGTVRRVLLETAVPFTVVNLRFARLAEGARCRDVDDDGDIDISLTRLWSVHRQNLAWRWSIRDYELEGTTAAPIRRRGGRLEVSGYNDPALARYTGVRCGSVELP